MSLTLTTVTGAACTGLTSPTFTLSQQSADASVKQWYVSSLGGTQTGVSTHTNELPFKVYSKVPTRFKIPGQRSLTTGQYTGSGAGRKNEISIGIVKGVNILDGLSGYQYDTINGSLSIRLPAAVGNDPEQISAFLSLFAGILWANATGIYDTARTGIL